MTPQDEANHFDVVVVGAGLGGLYGLHRFLKDGLRAVALEAAPGVGGVWFHNAYPGARVDVSSADYNYHFSPELAADWRWSERYASQPELLAYLNHVADRFGLRDHIRLSTPLKRALWVPEEARYHLTAGEDVQLTTRFLVMATGNLSATRRPNFPGLERFKGDWVQTSQWPHDRKVDTRGKRIGVVGTGSSGVQAIPLLAGDAEHLYVFQRSPRFSVPAQNRPEDLSAPPLSPQQHAERLAFLLTTKAGTTPTAKGPKPAAEYTPEEQRARLEAQWIAGGQGMNSVFGDQAFNKAANDITAEFVRGKIRSIVRDPAVAETLCPKDHPIGSRRLCNDIGYYETFNRPNVTLVDISQAPIEEITRTGIRTAEGEYALDLIVFALGFHAFRGVLDEVDIRNAAGETPTSRWSQGPRTLLGLMTHGFPNLFLPTAPGSPSVLANMFLINEIHMDWIADCIARMNAKGFATVEPEAEAEARWTQHNIDVAGPLLRLRFNNYMVQVNDDGSRVFMPYTGGLPAYVDKLKTMTAAGYEGFAFRRGDGVGPSASG